MFRWVLLLSLILRYFFFFQAEDGIRDYKVMEFRRVLFRSRHRGVKLAARRVWRYVAPRSATVSLIPLLFPTLIAGASQSGGIDSLSVLRLARRAQDAFEITRRENLPLRPSGSSDGRYEVIGRIRYWYEHGGDGDSAPPEPPQIRRARTRLLAALDVAGASLPGDEWIVGQRVRYLLEDSQPRLAARAVEQCRAVRSWCEALGGLVQHASGEFVAAESLFSTALADMPEDERCRWSDIAPLLDDKLSDRYRQLDCASRAAFEKRWWWLAQPLYSLAW